MNVLLQWIGRTPVRTFVVYPLLVLFGEWMIYGDRVEPNLWFSPLMLWGYLQYRLCGEYRSARGGGGPGPEIPGERLVSGGLYAYTRNPMYLGHIIFLTGLALTLRSWLAAFITVLVAIWLHFRVLADERNLSGVLGRDYIDYTRSVKRWLPGLF